LRNAGPLTWWDASRSRPGNELAFVWCGRLNFRAINNDYSGATVHQLGRLYREELAEGL
jgi:hypothetical protein